MPDSDQGLWSLPETLDRSVIRLGSKTAEVRQSKFMGGMFATDKWQKAACRVAVVFKSVSHVGDTSSNLFRRWSGKRLSVFGTFRPPDASNDLLELSVCP